MKINRTFIKSTNWVLAGILSMLGFIGCEKMNRTDEYGTPHADYTVKGAVVDKATGNPIAGIRVGYSSGNIYVPMYGTPSAPFVEKNAVRTDANGEFKLTETFFPSNGHVPVYVDDVDGAENGFYKSDTLQISFSEADRTKKSKSWYEGEFTKEVNVQLTEIQHENP